MKTLQERLIYAREKKQLSQTALGKAIGKSQSAIAALETGRNKSSTHTAKIADVLGVSALWLEKGEGEMSPAKLPDRQSLIPPAGGIAVLEDTDTTYTHKAIEMYDIKLSAGEGNGIWVQRNKEDPLVFRENWFRAKHLNASDLRGMYVKGDSMVPVLNNRDTVLIDISDLELVDGEIYAVVFKEKFYIRQIRHIEEGIELISYNPDYKPMTVTNNDYGRFQVLGRMVWRGG